MTRKKKPRCCVACGKAAKGHDGPMGSGKCPASLQYKGESRRGVVSDPVPTRRQKETAQQSSTSSGSGPAEAGARGPPVASATHPPASSGANHRIGGGLGPHRYASVVGLSGGPPTSGAGAPRVHQDSRRPDDFSPPRPQARPQVLRSRSPDRRHRVEPRTLRDVCHGPVDVRRELSCPPAFSSPIAPPLDDRYFSLQEARPSDRAHYAWEDRARAPLPLGPQREALRDCSFDQYGYETRSFEGLPSHPRDLPSRRRLFTSHEDLRRDYYGADRRPQIDGHLAYVGQPGDGSTEALPGAIHVSPKAKAMALAGEFCDLIDFLPDSFNINTDCDEFRTVVDSNGNLSLKSLKVKKQVTTSYKWLEAWAYYELILCEHYGARVFNEMTAYRLFILSLFNKYKLAYVLCYDVRHRQILGARRSLAFSSESFSTASYQAYITTFDPSAVKNVTKCGKCSSLDHPTHLCPFRAPGQANDDLPSRQRRGDRGDRQSDRQGDRGKGDRGVLCYAFQEGRCRAGAKCNRKHECMGCGGPEGHDSCSKCKPPKNAGNPGAKA